MKSFYIRSFLILAVLSMVAKWSVMSQIVDSSKNSSAIPLTVVVSEQQPSLSGSAVNVLTQSLIQVASKNGLAAAPGYGRFCLTAVVNATSRDLLPGPPAQIAQNMDISFYIVDNFDQKVFSTTTLSVKGVGTTEEKSFIKGLRSVRANDSRLASFVQKGRDAIVDYYSQQCDRIIREAQVVAAAHNYEEALFALSAIPEQCTECYNKVLVAAQDIYDAFIDYQCLQNLAKARSAWAAEQNTQGAQAAGVFLSEILPDADCYQDAMALYNEIKGKVLDDWKFEMKQYQDSVNLESQRINAWKEVGISYGNHQQPSDYNVNWLVR